MKLSKSVLPRKLRASLYCDNYRRKVNVLAELGKNAEAKDTAEFALDEFDFLL